MTDEELISELTRCARDYPGWTKCSDLMIVAADALRRRNETKAQLDAVQNRVDELHESVRSLCGSFQNFIDSITGRCR